MTRASGVRAPRIRGTLRLLGRGILAEGPNWDNSSEISSFVYSFGVESPSMS